MLIYNESYNTLVSKWVDLKTNSYFIANKSDFMRGYPKQDADQVLIYAIQPGSYSLERFYNPYHKHTRYRFVDMVYKVSTEGVNFEVKPGEVVYLGDFILKDEYSGKIEIKDSFAEVQKKFNERYPQLASQLKKRLITISPSFKINVPSAINSDKSSGHESR